MKKIIFLSLLFIFTLTGCGAGATETMSCSYETKNGNITTKMKYDIPNSRLEMFDEYIAEIDEKIKAIAQ